MKRREFLKKSLGGIVIAGGIQLISCCVHNPFVSERVNIVENYFSLHFG